MGILSFYPGIENIGLSLDSSHPFAIGNHNTFSFLERVGKPCLISSRGKSQDYFRNGKFLHLVHNFIVFLDSLLFNYCLHNTVYLLIFVVSNHPKLESRYHKRVHAALAFARKIEDFDDFFDPHHLFDYCLGPKPSKYVLEKIDREEKSKFILEILKVSLSL